MNKIENVVKLFRERLEAGHLMGARRSEVRGWDFGGGEGLVGPGR